MSVNCPGAALKRFLRATAHLREKAILAVLPGRSSSPCRGNTDGSEGRASRQATEDVAQSPKGSMNDTLPGTGSKIIGVRAFPMSPGAYAGACWLNAFPLGSTVASHLPKAVFSFG